MYAIITKEMFENIETIINAIDFDFATLNDAIHEAGISDTTCHWVDYPNLGISALEAGDFIILSQE